MLLRPDLGWMASARTLRPEQRRWRDPHRLLFQIDLAGPSRRLSRCELGYSVAYPCPQKRCGLRCLGTDGPGRILRRALYRTRAEIEPGLAQETRSVAGRDRATVRNRVRV